MIGSTILVHLLSDVLLDDPCAANATDDNAMRKTAANDRIHSWFTSLVLGFRKPNECARSGVPSSATTCVHHIDACRDARCCPVLGESDQLLAGFN